MISEVSKYSGIYQRPTSLGNWEKRRGSSNDEELISARPKTARPELFRGQRDDQVRYWIAVTWRHLLSQLCIGHRQLLILLGFWIWLRDCSFPRSTSGELETFGQYR